MNPAIIFSDVLKTTLLRLLAILLLVVAVHAQPGADRSPALELPVVNVKQTPYFAVGDGKHDDTNAIQSAIAAVQATNGSLRFPCGTYLFSKEISISRRITIEGTGDGDGNPSSRACTILQKTADVIGIHIRSGADYTTLKDFRLTSVATTGAADGIVIGDADKSNGAGEVVLRDVFVDHQRGSGINVRNGNAGVMDHVTVSANGANGILISSQQIAVSNTNAWRVYSSTALGNRQNGFAFNVAAATEAHGLDAEGNGQSGIFCGQSQMLIEGHSEGNIGANLRTNGSCFGSFVVVSVPDDKIVQGNPFSYIINPAHPLGPFTNPLSGRFGVQGQFSTPRIVPTYGPEISISAARGNYFVITATDSKAFTIKAPDNRDVSQRITITILNASGGQLGRISWSPVYLMSAWVNPANGFSRSIDFQLDPHTGKWTEVGRTPADVPN